MVENKKLKIAIAIIIILVIILALLVCGLLIHFEKQKSLSLDDNAAKWRGEQYIKRPMIGNQPAIAIPGYDKLYLTANSVNQKVNFYNPEENDCLFVMQFIVDGTTLWESGYVQPGYGYYDITLSNPISAGEYDGSLRIQCFKNTGEALNSAKTSLKIIVEGEQE